MSAPGVELSPTLAITALPILRLVIPGIVALFGWLLFSKLLGSESNGRPIGVQSSNLKDEFEYSAGGTEDVAEWKVKSLWIFPVKSCRGIELSEARVVPTGLEHDRQFMFAEYKPNPNTGNSEWIFITQRQYPEMALITTKIFAGGDRASGGKLAITFPLISKFSSPSTFGLYRQERTFCFPLAATRESMSQYPLKPVKIWKDRPLAYDISSSALVELGELSSLLGSSGPLALFRVCNDELRPVYRNAPRGEELGYQPVTGFADAYPLHLLNLASVRELNSRIEDKIQRLSALRFRPNIIVSGPKAFHEDDWKLVSLGGNIYHSACRTVRCKMPNIDQDTAEKHMQEPDQTMRSYRNIDEGNKQGACLGMQLVPAEKVGTLRAGDSLVVLETGLHCYINQ